MSDIAELFSRDPLSLTDDDIEQMVIRLRQERARFLTQPRTRRDKPAKESPMQNLDLSGIEL